jgi:SAM-dependent methyltransferase
MLYDLDLFEQLNDEYREHPIVPIAALANRRAMLSPTTQDRAVRSRQERVEYATNSQLKPILADVELDDAVALDLGCGHGFLTAALVESGGAAGAYGVDIKRYPTWDEHLDPRLEFLAADVSRDLVLPPNSIDVVVSQVVFEHVDRPLQMLAAVHALLKQGGTAWLRMNLYTARNASHRYREVFFPWPHLLFEDAVVEEFYRRHHERPRQLSWVNRMTAAHYVHAAQRLGFGLVKVLRKVSPIDVPFYLRFVDNLGRYPALDLETDFLTLILTKGPVDDERTAACMAEVNYLERQLALDERIARFEAERDAATAEPPASAETPAHVATGGGAG